MIPVERQEYYREEIKKLLLKQGEEPTEEKVEQIMHDLEVLAEIFVESEIEKRRL